MKQVFLLIAFFSFAFFSCKKDDPIPSISVAEHVFTEGTTDNVTITLSAPSTIEVSVTVTISDGTASINEDFTATAFQKIVFAPGETEKKIEVQVKLDPPEAEETFKVGLSAPVNATISDATTTQKIAASTYFGHWIVFNDGAETVYMGFEPTKFPYSFVNQYFIGGSQWTNASGLKAVLGVGIDYLQEPSPADLWDYCIVGNKSYAQFGNGTTSAGFFVEYTDKNGVLWKSEIGSHTASDKFKVTNRGSNLGGFYDFSYLGEFSCTLYDANGNTKKISNGKFYAETPQP